MVNMKMMWVLVFTLKDVFPTGRADTINTKSCGVIGESGQTLSELM